MSTSASITELQKMSVSELRRDLLAKRAEVAKMRLSIEMGSEKDHARYQREKKQVARMTMVLMQAEKKAPATVADAPKVTKASSQSPKKPVQRSGSKKKKAA